MASNQTEHYGLNQWEAEDDFLRREFNEDNRRVDEAIAGKPNLWFGVYLGEQKPDTTTVQFITLGYQPKMVFVIPETGVIADTSGRGNGGLFSREKALNQSSGPECWAAWITEDGFAVRNYDRAFYQLNQSGKTYHYLIIA